MSRPSPGSQETDIARKGPTPLGASDAFALRSDLARYSLSRDGRDETRHLAWTNSICVVVLMIAAMGLRQPPITVRPPRPPPESTRSILLPPLEPEVARTPEEHAAPSAEPAIAELPAPPEPIPVARPGEVSFAIPVTGYVELASDPRLVPPPPRLLRAVPDGEFRAIRFGGREFRRQPPPNYPEHFQRQRIGGTVEALISVGTNGIPDAVRVGRSSGSPALDAHVTEFIRREWRADPGPPAHYRIAITFAP